MTSANDRHPGGPCLTDDDLAVLAAGGLGGDAPAAELHLDGCERCRRALSMLAAAAFDDAPALDDASPSSQGDIQPGQRLGRFTIVRSLGHGAMGEVWAARDPELDREVALKLLRMRAELDDSHTLRLRREAQAMARLSHPNVVSIHELGSDGNRMFCAMELVDGVTLRTWLETPRHWREIFDVTLAAGRGLAAAHAAGLVHRDVKPDNILLSRDGRTLVTDFGLAKLIDLADDAVASSSQPVMPPPDSPTTGHHHLTATGMVLGTPVYMPPEQLEGDRADAASDQFSYCVTLYEALFGVRPFAGPTLAALAEATRRAARRSERSAGGASGRRPLPPPRPRARV